MAIIRHRLHDAGLLVLNHSKSPVFLGALVLLAFLKSGAVDMSPNPKQVSEENSVFPNPTGILTPISYGMRITNWVLGPETRIENLAIGAVLLLAALAAICVVLIRIKESLERSFLLIAVLLGPITAILLGNLGRNDVFLLLGSVMVGSAIPVRREDINGGGARFTAGAGLQIIAGMLLMILGNPEQTVVAMMLLSALTLTTHFRLARPYALIGLVIAVAFYSVLALWSRSQDLLNRFELVDEFWSQSTQNFSLNFSLVIFSGFGLVWFFCAILLLNSKVQDLLVLIPTLVLIPIAVTASTVDQTRVWVGITGLISILVVRHVSTVVPTGYQWEVTGSLLVVAILIPSFEVTYLGQVRSPFDYIHFLLTSGSLQ